MINDGVNLIDRTIANILEVMTTEEDNPTTEMIEETEVTGTTTEAVKEDHGEDILLEEEVLQTMLKEMSTLVCIPMTDPGFERTEEASATLVTTTILDERLNLRI